MPVERGDFFVRFCGETASSAKRYSVTRLKVRERENFLFAGLVEKSIDAEDILYLCRRTEKRKLRGSVCEGKKMKTRTDAEKGEVVGRLSYSTLHTHAATHWRKRRGSRRTVIHERKRIYSKKKEMKFPFTLVLHRNHRRDV